LKGGKETSDLAKYFPPFKTQIGPKIKKMASDYVSASLLTAKQVHSSVTKTGGTLPVCTNWCGANLKQDFFTVYTQTLQNTLRVAKSSRFDFGPKMSFCSRAEP